MKRRTFAAIVGLTLFGGAPAWSVDGNILVRFGDDCDAWLGANCRTRMEIYGLLQGASVGGITGAEYGIEFTPANVRQEFVLAETFPMGSLILGTGAFTSSGSPVRGVNVAWGACQAGGGIGNNLVLLETVDLLRLTGDFLFTEGHFQVVRHDQPSNPFFQCPLFTLCDAPTYTKVCVGSNLTLCPNPEPPHANNATCSTSGEAWINGRECCLSCAGAVVDCNVAAEAETWSRVKLLYGH